MFKDLIGKYSTSFTLVKASAGGYVDGEYVAGEKEEEIRTGTILPLSAQKLYQAGGSYTTRDMQLYSNLPVTLDGNYVLYKGRKYKVQEDADYGDLAEVYLYILKWVENFGRTEADK